MISATACYVLIQGGNLLDELRLCVDNIGADAMG
jgi:hypothetical protein